MNKNKRRESNSCEEWKYIPLDDPSMVYSSSDLGLSTALLCVGYELLSVDKENPRKSIFIFKKDRNIEEIANLYFSDKLEVHARLYFDHLKALKNQLYSE